MMVGCLVEICKRYVNADKSKVMVLNGEEGLNVMRCDWSM